MKSKIKVNKKFKALKYPKLMAGSTTGVVVLMVEDSCGTVVYQADNNSPQGSFSDKWSMASFTDFKGRVILSN